MLSTKDMSAGSGKARPVIGVGNQKIKINSITFDACVGGREWENKEGYVNYDLYLPRNSKDGVALETLEMENSRLYEFSKKDHVRELQNKKSSPTTDNFEPASTAGEDFDL